MKIESGTPQVKDLIPMYETREANPNKLDEERYAGLKALMAANGCLQPILVHWKAKGTLVIVDGHHRYWIAKELGWKSIDAIYIKDVDDAKVRAFSLAMNRARGDLDLTLSADVMRDIMIESGWDVTQLSQNTAFTEKEVEGLINAAKTFEDADLSDVGAGVGDEGAEAPVDKPFVLEVAFSNKEDLKLVRRKLKKAAGKGGDLGRGLLNVLGEDDHGSQ